ncbi:MAG: T9SS type A sorting domain-containing protein, partial [Bacteroidota bacterium]
GGFTTSPSTDGIYKYQTLAQINCGDAAIQSGVGSAPDLTICFGDTLFFSTSGAVPPNQGTTYGFSIIVSTLDISGNPNPLGTPGVVGGSGVNYPAPAVINTTLINNGTIFQAGVYYFTPVVYGNATGTGNVTALTLDPGCTYTGTSVMVTLYAAGDPNCNTGIIENGSNAELNAYFSSETLQLNIISSVSEKTNVEILDISGKVVYRESLDIYSGTNTHGINAQGLSTGTYSIRITGNSVNAVQKVVKM